MRAFGGILETTVTHSCYWLKFKNDEEFGFDQRLEIAAKAEFRDKFG